MCVFMHACERNIMQDVYVGGSLIPECWWRFSSHGSNGSRQPLVHSFSFIQVVLSLRVPSQGVSPTRRRNNMWVWCKWLWYRRGPSLWSLLLLSPLYLSSFFCPLLSCPFLCLPLSSCLLLPFISLPLILSLLLSASLLFLGKPALLPQWDP